MREHGKLNLTFFQHSIYAEYVVIALLTALIYDAAHTFMLLYCYEKGLFFPFILV